jgi:hypothetical protein
MKLVGSVVLCIGLASFAVFTWATRKVISLDRAVDIGDGVLLGVFAIFGAFCVALAWRLFGDRSFASAASEEPAAAAVPPKRVTLSKGCAAAGVLLLMLSVLIPADWHPVAFLFLGLALLAISHALTPCVERIEQLRKARASVRQL